MWTKIILALLNCLQEAPLACHIAVSDLVTVLIALQGVALAQGRWTGLVEPLPPAGKIDANCAFGK